MKIWIINHYAMPPEYEMRLRTLMMAKYLQKFGHDVRVICASTIHNTDINLIDKKGPLFLDKEYDGIKFLHIKVSSYSGNGFSRIKNMLEFVLRLRKLSEKVIPNPDCIICDSGALLAPVPYKIARKKKAKFVLEVRDLWPESIIEYKKMSRRSIFVKIMYAIEKWMYKKSDDIVFTMEGGKDYIIDKGWENTVNLQKVHYINNGVDLSAFIENRDKYVWHDQDLDREDTFKVVYAGSIRLANNVKKIVEAAQVIQKMNRVQIQFIIYGDGTDRIPLQHYCLENNITNVKFKGQVEKKYISNILSKSDVNILHFEQNSLKKYGVSLNKLFEYFASGKPTISDCEFGYDLINRYQAGVSKDIDSPNHIAEEIIKLYDLEKEKYNQYCVNAYSLAKDYDYEKLMMQFNSDIILSK